MTPRPPRSPASSFAIGVTISLALHAAGLAAVLQWPSGQPPSMAGEAITVSLVIETSSGAEGAPAAPPPTPPEPQQSDPPAVRRPPPSPDPAPRSYNAETGAAAVSPAEPEPPEARFLSMDPPPPKPTPHQTARLDPADGPDPAETTRTSPRHPTATADGDPAPLPPAASGAASVMPPQVANGNRPPNYPPSARRRGQEGVVIIRVTVAVDGRASATTIVTSSGVPILDEAAIEAVRSWRFLPAHHGAEQVAGTLDVPIRFDLDG